MFWGPFIDGWVVALERTKRGDSILTMPGRDSRDQGVNSRSRVEWKQGHGDLELGKIDAGWRCCIGEDAVRDVVITVM